MTAERRVYSDRLQGSILVNIFISDFSEDPEGLLIRFADFTKLKAFELIKIKGEIHFW